MARGGSKGCKIYKGGEEIENRNLIRISHVMKMIIGFMYVMKFHPFYGSFVFVYF